MKRKQLEADIGESQVEIPFNGASILDIEEDAIKKAFGDIL